MLASVKKWWIPAAAAGVVISSLGAATTWSYVKTAWSGVGQAIRDATPISFELQRLDGMIADLGPEIRRNQQVVAQLEVECEYLNGEVAAMRSKQEEALAQMRHLRAAIGEAKTEYTIGGQTYSRDQVDRDLARRLDQYEERKAQLAAKEQLLEQRRRTLEAATSKLAEYRRQYEQMVGKAESLQAELKLVEAAQAAGKLEFDNSKLAQTRQLAQDVEKRIRVLQRLVDAERQAEGEIPVQADSRSAAERFDEMFGSRSLASARANSDQ